MKLPRARHTAPSPSAWARERAEQQAYFIAAATAALAGRLIPVPGGVLVRAEDGTIKGAVGISGDSSDNDETAAATAIEAAGLTAQVA
ncbi:MAG: hypothetical protein NVS1B16_03430 [Pseudarthrobacter sp.]